VRDAVNMKIVSQPNNTQTVQTGTPITIAGTAANFEINNSVSPEPKRTETISLSGTITSPASYPTVRGTSNCYTIPASRRCWIYQVKIFFDALVPSPTPRTTLNINVNGSSAIAPINFPDSFATPYTTSSPASTASYVQNPAPGVKLNAGDRLQVFLNNTGGTGEVAAGTPYSIEVELAY
jgi:hypothetical protein